MAGEIRLLVNTPNIVSRVTFFCDCKPYLEVIGRPGQQAMCWNCHRVYQVEASATVTLVEKKP